MLSFGARPLLPLRREREEEEAYERKRKRKRKRKGKRGQNSKRFLPPLYFYIVRRK